MTAILEIIDLSGTLITLTDVLSFKVVKDRYVPYSTLYAKASFLGTYTALKGARLIVGASIVFYGLIDSVQFVSEEGIQYITVRSSGFTSSLCRNNLTPGMKTDISLNSLMDSFISLPNVEHENNDTVLNYIYVVSGTSFWDAVVNLTYKLNGGYPYIGGNNTVMVTEKVSPLLVALTEEAISEWGTINDYTKILSDYHMEDAAGTYNTFNETNPDAYARDIVRHRQIPLDYQYLNNPAQSLVNRLNTSMRAFKAIYAVYAGYNGEELSDLMELEDETEPVRIGRIEISGNENGIFTKCMAYFDRYCNNE